MLVFKHTILNFDIVSFNLEKKASTLADKHVLEVNMKSRHFSPGWAKLTKLVGVSSHTPKSNGFDAWSGHMLGLWVDPWSACMQEAEDQLFSLSLSYSLSLPLSLESVNISSGED